MCEGIATGSQDRAGQGRTVQGRGEQGRAGQGRAEQGRAEQGRVGQNRTGKDRTVSAVRDEDVNRRSRFNVAIIVSDEGTVKILTRNLSNCKNTQRCI